MWKSTISKSSIINVVRRILYLLIYVNVSSPREYGWKQYVRRARIPIRRSHLRIRHRNATMRYSAAICGNSQRHCLLEFKMQSTFSPFSPINSRHRCESERFPYSVCRFRRLLSIGGQTDGWSDCSVHFVFVECSCFNKTYV